jgi:hypothetical protein
MVFRTDSEIVQSGISKRVENSIWKGPRISVLTRAQCWRPLATVPFLVLFFPGTAYCQEDPQTAEHSEPIRFDYLKHRSFPNVFSAYTAPHVPGPRLSDRRLQDLIDDGKLNLSLDDAIALAIDNNLGIAVARYDLPIAQADLLRAEGGGATHGVAGIHQSSTLFFGSLGGGVGSGAVASGSGVGGILGGGINGVDAARCCDPSLSFAYGWSDAITPLNYTVVSGVPVETTHQVATSAVYSQGFLTGSSLFVGQFAAILDQQSPYLRSGTGIEHFSGSEPALVARLWYPRQQPVHPHRSERCQVLHEHLPGTCDGRGSGSDDHLFRPAGGP